MIPPSGSSVVFNIGTFPHASVGRKYSDISNGLYMKGVPMCSRSSLFVFCSWTDTDPFMKEKRKKLAIMRNMWTIGHSLSWMETWLHQSVMWAPPFVPPFPLSLVAGPQQVQVLLLGTERRGVCSLCIERTYLSEASWLPRARRHLCLHSHSCFPQCNTV